MRLGFTVAAGVALATAWLAVATLAGRAGVGRAVTGSVDRAAALAEVVTRRVGPTRAGTAVQVTYVTPEYLALSGQNPAEAAGGTVFLIYEENHYRGLPAPDQESAPLLRADGQALYEPVEWQLVTDSEHHRTWRARFAQTAQTSVELLLPGLPGAEPLRWDLPLRYPQAPGRQSVSPGTFLALTAGLFAALSPCLLQLTLYYLSSLAGVSLSRPAPRQMLATAAWFVAGMAAAYTAGGALAGFAGQQLQVTGALGAWSRPVAAAAGVAVVGLGLWTGASAGAPVLCKLPLPSLARTGRRAGALGSMAMGFVFSLGCLQCFGGAIFASLLLYVGSLGSPLQGALMLGLFSLGVGLPFLLAAATWSRALPLMEKLQRYTPALALVTSAIMVSFGLLMIADRFHWVSSLLVRWLPFLAV